jgi:hypothetical protein
LARPREIVEMSLDAVGQSVSSRPGGTAMPCDVAAAHLNDRDVLTGSGGARQKRKYCNSKTALSQVPLHVIPSRAHALARRQHRLKSGSLGNLYDDSMNPLPSRKGRPMRARFISRRGVRSRSVTNTRFPVQSPSPTRQASGCVGEHAQTSAPTRISTIPMPMQ